MVEHFGSFGWNHTQDRSPCDGLRPQDVTPDVHRELPARWRDLGFSLIAGLVALFMQPVIGSAADLQYPLSVAAAEDGPIYLADRDMHGVWKVVNGELGILFEGSKKFRTPLNAARCVALDKKGRVLAGDSATREIYRFNDSNQPEPLTKGEIGIPMAIAVLSSGAIVACDLEIHQIVRIDEEGGKPVKVAEVQAPRGIAVDADDRIWIVSHGKNQVVRILADGKVETVVEGRPFEFPHTMALDKDTNAYVCDGYAKAVWKIPVGGKPQKWVSGEPLKNPVGIAWQGNRLLVADPHAKAVFAINPEGQISTIVKAVESK